MQKLINALYICKEYKGGIHCEHDQLMLVIDLEKISEADILLLEKYTFEWDWDYEAFVSFYFGSC